MHSSSRARQFTLHEDIFPSIILNCFWSLIDAANLRYTRITGHLILWLWAWVAYVFFFDVVARCCVCDLLGSVSPSCRTCVFLIVILSIGAKLLIIMQIFKKKNMKKRKILCFVFFSKTTRLVYYCLQTTRVKQKTPKQAA